MAGTEALDGPWLKAPGSWLHLLIRHLPSKDKLVLFQTCRSLAKQVVLNAPSVKLSLRQQQAQQRVEARREVISTLLGECNRVHVLLRTYMSQLFPFELGGGVTEVTLHPNRYVQRPADYSFDWSKLVNLHTVRLVGVVSMADVSCLCDALETGQLPALRSLGWEASRHSPAVHKAAAEECHKLAAAAGRQVEDLTTDSNCLLKHLEKFTELKSLTFLGDLSKEGVHHLCDHLTLKRVTLIATDTSRMFAKEVEGDHSQRECNWDCVTFHRVSPTSMAALPLAAVQAITLSHAAIHKRYCSPGFAEDEQALESILNTHAGKVVCIPSIQKGGDAFCLSCCSDVELQVLKYLKNVHTLHIFSVHSPVGCLQKLYECLPVSIHSIVFSYCDVLKLWNGLPQHVTHMQLAHALNFPDLASLVSSAPAHVRKLTLTIRCTEPGPMSLVYDAVLAVAPSHLSVALKSWH